MIALRQTIPARLLHLDLYSGILCLAVRIDAGADKVTNDNGQ